MAHTSKPFEEAKGPCWGPLGQPLDWTPTIRKHPTLLTADSKKLECGPGTIYACSHSSLGFRFGGQSYFKLPRHPAGSKQYKPQFWTQTLLWPMVWIIEPPRRIYFLDPPRGLGFWLLQYLGRPWAAQRCSASWALSSGPHWSKTLGWMVMVQIQRPKQFPISFWGVWYYSCITNVVQYWQF